MAQQGVAVTGSLHGLEESSESEDELEVFSPARGVAPAKIAVEPDWSAVPTNASHAPMPPPSMVVRPSPTTAPVRNMLCYNKPLKRPQGQCHLSVCPLCACLAYPTPSSAQPVASEPPASDEDDEFAYAFEARLPPRLRAGPESQPSLPAPCRAALARRRPT